MSLRLSPIVKFAALVSVALSFGCGSSPPISITLQPSSPQIDQGQQVTILATLVNDNTKAGVRWSLSGPGSLSNPTNTFVTYLAPAPTTPSSPTTVKVLATSEADPNSTATAQITVNPLPRITTQSLPVGTAGTAYSQALAESGGTPPFQWSVTSGAIPNGLSLNPSTGALSGTPAGGGTWNFTAHLADASVGGGATDTSADLALTITTTAPPGSPAPFLSQPLVPSAVAPGSTAFTLTANGAGFVPGAVVELNGTALPTAFVNGGRLTAVVPSAALASAGTATVTVVNPAPGGGRSNAAFLYVATPETIASFNDIGGPGTGAYPVLSLAVGDFNGDAKLDLAALGATTLGILLGSGDGNFTEGEGLLPDLPEPNTQESALLTADLNNDGKLDLAVANSDPAINNIPIFLGNGDGTFTPSSASGTTQHAGACSLAVADFNQDGNLDLAVGNNISSIAILLGYGDGAFTEVAAQPSGNLPAGCPMAVGDFNGDGKLDLAVENGASTVAILLGNGDGTFLQAPGSPIAVGGQPDALSVADLNGDGKPDLVVANGADNDLSILLGNGDGTFTPAAGSPIAVGSKPTSVAIGDFLANGKLDLAVTNSGSNSVSVLFGNGDGSFREASNSPIPAADGALSVAVADFNGDGRPDLAVADENDNDISIFLQQ